jgi:hypothetical protein
MAKPPTIHTLLDDPVMRKVILTSPPLPAALKWGEPWLLWAQRHDGVWASRSFATYADAWERARPIIKDRDRFSDVAIVSKRVFFAPPPGAHWGFGLDWCSRCRRPSSFREWNPASHHALKRKNALTFDEPKRCWYCGIRKAAMPSYSGRG